MALVLFGCAKSDATIAYALIGNKEYKLEIADDSAERTKGLSNRQRIAGDGGMIFVFEKTDFHSFWMKDTLIPLEILWLDADFMVVDKKLMPVEEDPTNPQNDYIPSAPARYVIEINPLGAAADVNVGDVIDVAF